MFYYSNDTYVRRHMSKTEGRDTEDREAFAKLTVRPYIEGIGVRRYVYKTNRTFVYTPVCKTYYLQ